MKKFYVHEIAAVDLSKIYFLKNVKKTCKPNNHDLNRDRIVKSDNNFNDSNLLEHLQWSSFVEIFEGF